MRSKLINKSIFLIMIVIFSVTTILFFENNKISNNISKITVNEALSNSSEQGEKSKSSPKFYGTTDITIKKGQSLDLTSSFYRIFAKDYLGRDITRNITIVSNDVKTDVIGDYTIKYKVVDLEKNEAQIEVPVHVTESNHKVQRTLYSLESTAHIQQSGSKRGDNQDSQMLGVYLNAGESVNINVIKNPYDISILGWQSTSETDANNFILDNNNTTKITAKNDEIPLIRTRSLIKKYKKSNIEGYAISSIENSIFFANVFERDTTDVENLSKIEIPTYGCTSYKVYVNPLNGDLKFDETNLVYEKDSNISNGTEIINANGIKLYGDKFSIAVEYNGTSIPSSYDSNADQYTYIATSLDGKWKKGVRNIPSIKAEVDKCNEDIVIEVDLSNGVKPLNYYRIGDGEEAQIKFRANEYNCKHSLIEGERTSIAVSDTDLDRIIVNDTDRWKLFFQGVKGDVNLYNQLNLTDQELIDRFFFKSLDDILEYYDNVITTFDSYIGLELKPKEQYNKNVLSKFYFKVCTNGSMAYDSEAYVEVVSFYIKGDPDANQNGYVYTLGPLMVKGWGALHEIGHGYEGRWYGIYYGHDNKIIEKNTEYINLSETANNIFAYLYEREFIKDEEFKVSWLVTSGFANEKNQKAWTLKDLDEALNKAHDEHSDANYFDEIVKDGISMKGINIESNTEETNRLDWCHLKSYFIISKVFGLINLNESNEIIFNNNYDVIANLYRNYRKELNILDSAKYTPADRVVKAVYETTGSKEKADKVIQVLKDYKIIVSDDVFQEKNCKYKVEYYYQDIDGKYPSTPTKVSEERVAEVGKNVHIKSTDRYCENPLYILDELKNDEYSGVAKADNSLVLKVYFQACKRPVLVDLADIVVDEYKNAIFTIDMEREGIPATYTYQWYVNDENNTTNGQIIDGATEEIYIVNGTKDLNGKYYYCEVKNGIYTTRTNAAKLTVNPIKYTLKINGKGSAVMDIEEGEDVTATITCSSDPLEEIERYEIDIYTDDGTIQGTETLTSEGAENNTIKISSLYLWGDIRITGKLYKNNTIIGTTNSINIRLNKAVTLEDLKDKETNEGERVEFEVKIKEDGKPSTYSYQWYISDSSSNDRGGAIKGATDSKYEIENPTIALNNKYYYCEVKNGVCVTKTNAVKLTVNENDKDGPIISEVELSSYDWTKKNKLITITATDSKSGVAGYGISNSINNVPENWSSDNVIELSENGTYYVWAKDNKGNVSCYNTAIESKIDKKAPEIKEVIVINNIITVIGIEDEESGIAQISISTESGRYKWKNNTNSTYMTGKLSEGTYYIAVRDKAGNITEQSKQVKNEVILINNIKLSQESLQLNSTINSTKLIATVEPENATNKDLTWRSSNPQIATVDKNGLVTAISDGTVDIIVEATDGSGKSKTIKCTVTEHTNPTKIEIQGKDRIRKGEKSTYTIKYEPENANINKELIWSVNDEEIATINNETGDLEGKSAGEVIITAKLKNIENIIATKKVEVYYEKSTTTKPEVTVTTNSIKLENKQTNEYEKITKIEYGISKDGEIWSWQTEDTFKDLEDNKEYKVKTKVTDENGIKIESEIQTVTTEELIMAKILFKKDNSEEYKVNSWSNSNISYEIIDEKNLTTVKVLNSNNEELKLQGNEITDNGIFAILVETSDGTNTKNEMYTVKIDKGSINIELDNGDNNQVDSRKLKINLRNSVSGIKLVKINGEKVDIDTNSDEFVYEITNNGTYKIEVEDNAGNILEKTVEITNIAEKNYEDPEKNDKNSEQDKDSNKGKNENTSGKPLPKTGERIVIFRIISMIIIAGIIYIVKIAREPKQ